jgi:hypothetical protein
MPVGVYQRHPKEWTKERLLSRAEPEQNSGCWLWFRSLDGKGYGSVSLNGKNVRAHRLSWVLHKGPIPHGLCLLHKCDTPACINPDHMRIGTHAENMRDRTIKGRGATFPGNKNPNSKLSSEQVDEIRRLRGQVTQRALANQFGVCKSAIERIHLGQSWVR